MQSGDPSPNDLVLGGSQYSEPNPGSLSLSNKYHLINPDSDIISKLIAELITALNFYYQIRSSEASSEANFSTKDTYSEVVNSQLLNMRKQIRSITSAQNPNYRILTPENDLLKDKIVYNVRKLGIELSAQITFDTHLRPLIIELYCKFNSANTNTEFLKSLNLQFNLNFLIQEGEDEEYKLVSTNFLYLSVILGKLIELQLSNDNNIIFTESLAYGSPLFRISNEKLAKKVKYFWVNLRTESYAWILSI